MQTNTNTTIHHNDNRYIAPRVISLQQALASTTPASLRAVADWNDRKSYDERRRKARARHKGQAAALRVVADEMGRGAMKEAA